MNHSITIAMNQNTDGIKKIIAFFLNIEAASVNEETVIDNSILQGSVKIHMMYGNLADNGYKIANYSTIRTYKDLLARLNLPGGSTGGAGKGSGIKKENTTGSPGNETTRIAKGFQTDSIGIGVDILQVSKLPRTDDFRESSFYTDNFSLREFAYCLLKADPYKAFAGKFAAKEAIVKANNEYKEIPFREIEVINEPGGKPVFETFSISISYEDDYAIATAVYDKRSLEKEKKLPDEQENENRLKRMEQGIKKLHDELPTLFLKKSYKGLIIFSLILNIALVIYIIATEFSLF